MDRQSGNGDEGRNMVDLTLKLGLPSPNNTNNDQSYVVPSHQFSNLNFNTGPHTTPPQQLASYSRMINGRGQASMYATDMVNSTVNYGMINEGRNLGMVNMGNNQNQNENGVESFNRSPIAWPSEQMENHNHNYINGYGSGVLMNRQHLQYNNNNNIGSVVGIPIMAHNDQYANFNYGDNTVSGSSASSSSSSSIRRRRDSRRQNSGGGSYINDQNKRCTNLSCNTNETPMWRKGPLGPKTLCNACGIKYRKEGERKRAKEAERTCND